MFTSIEAKTDPVEKMLMTDFGERITSLECHANLIEECKLGAAVYSCSSSCKWISAMAFNSSLSANVCIEKKKSAKHLIKHDAAALFVRLQPQSELAWAWGALCFI